MEIDPNLLIKYRTVRPNIQMNACYNANIYQKESICVDDNLMDLTVSKNILRLIFVLIINLGYKSRCKRANQWKKKKNSEIIEFQIFERRNDEETDKLLSYLEEHYEKL